MKNVTFKVGEKRIAALVNDNASAPTLLFLHGWLDNAASFQPLMPYLNDYNVIAIDWPGHGMSEHRSDDAHYHFLDWVYDLLQLFETQQWRPLDIVAHSMGGMIASAFAAAFPEYVKSLTLIDTVGFLTQTSEETTQQLRKGMQSRLSRKKNIKHHSDIDLAVIARMQVSDLTKANAVLLVKRGIKQTAQGFQWSSDGRLRTISPYRLTLEQAEQLINDIKAPVQLIYGDSGMEMVTKGLAHFGEKFTNLKVYQLSGGHHVHMEQPEQVSNLIKGFVASN